MKISVREFGREPSRYLKSLPITLTQYNKPVAHIVPIDDTKESTLPMSTDVAVTPTTGKYMQNDIAEDYKKYSQAIGPCAGFNCKNKGRQYEGKGITEEGEVKKRMFLCNRHLMTAKKEVEDLRRV